MAITPRKFDKSVTKGIYGWHSRGKHRGEVSAKNSSRKVGGILNMYDITAQRWSK